MGSNPTRNSWNGNCAKDVSSIKAICQKYDRDGARHNNPGRASGLSESFKLVTKTSYELLTIETGNIVS